MSEKGAGSLKWLEARTGCSTRELELQRVWQRVADLHGLDQEHQATLADALSAQDRLDVPTLVHCAELVTRDREDAVQTLLRGCGIRPEETSPLAGRLGWIACHAGLSQLDLESALLLQQARRERCSSEQLGELLIELRMITVEKRDELLQLQQAWLALQSAASISPQEAEEVASSLASRQRFDSETLEALRGLAANLPWAIEHLGPGPRQQPDAAWLEQLRRALAEEGAPWSLTQLAAVADPARAPMDVAASQRVLARIEARSLLGVDELRRADRIASILAQHGCPRSGVDVLVDLGLLSHLQVELLTELAAADETEQQGKLIAGWAGRFGLIVRRASRPELRHRTYRFYDGEHVVGRQSVGFSLGDALLEPRHARLVVRGDEVFVEPLQGDVFVETDGQRMKIHAPHSMAPGSRFDLGLAVTIQFLDAEGIAQDSQFFTDTVEEIFNELAIEGVARRTSRTPTPTTIAAATTEEAVAERESSSNLESIESARTSIRAFHERESTRLSAVPGLSAQRMKVLTTEEHAVVRRMRVGLLVSVLTGAVLVLAGTIYLARGRPAPKAETNLPLPVAAEAALVEGRRTELRGELSRVVFHPVHDGIRRFHALLVDGERMTVIEGDERVHQRGLFNVRDGVRVVVNGTCRRFDGPPARLPNGVKARLYLAVERLDPLR